MKATLITCALIMLSFAFGFTLNGYIIYRDIVGNMAGAVNIEKGK